MISRRAFLTSTILSTAGAAICAEQPGPAAPPAKPKAKKAPKKEPKKEPYADAVLVKGEPAPTAEGAFTLVVLPDTQYYSQKYPDTFAAQTRWITEQRAARKIAGVLHLGDVTNSNTPDQWTNTEKAMSLLDPQIPLCMVPGNHDYGPNGRGTSRATDFTKTFPQSFFKQRPSSRGFYDKEPDRSENSYHLFEAGGRKLLALGLEFGPRPDVVRWAREVLARHPDHEAILVTHAYAYHNDTRYDWVKYGKKQNNNPHEYELCKAPGTCTDGEELWQQLVSPHGRFLFTINGHVTGDGLARLSTPDSKGRSVPQILVNFQMRPNGGDGWLRLLEFRPDGHMHAIDYSPVRGERNESGQNCFKMKLPGV